MNKLFALLLISAMFFNSALLFAAEDAVLSAPSEAAQRAVSDALIQTDQTLNDLAALGEENEDEEALITDETDQAVDEAIEAADQADIAEDEAEIAEKKAEAVKREAAEIAEKAAEAARNEAQRLATEDTLDDFDEK